MFNGEIPNEFNIPEECSIRYSLFAKVGNIIQRLDIF